MGKNTLLICNVNLTTNLMKEHLKILDFVPALKDCLPEI